MTPEREITYRFHELPYVIREEILNELGINDIGDKDLKDEVRYAGCFRRAKERGLLEAFWDKIKARTETPMTEPNPFKPKPKTYRDDPEFLRIQAEAAEAQKKLNAAFKEVQEKFPAPDGFSWAMTAAGTLGRFPYSTGDQE